MLDRPTKERARTVEAGYQIYFAACSVAITFALFISNLVLGTDVYAPGIGTLIGAVFTYIRISSRRQAMLEAQLESK